MNKRHLQSREKYVRILNGKESGDGFAGYKK